MKKNPATPRLDLNPSSADRWTTCTASPHFIMENWDKLPPSDNRFSREGTTAHEVAAAYLQNRAPRETDKDACPTPIDADMRMHGWDYMEYVLGLRAPVHRIYVEKKYPLWYMPERNALIDALVDNITSIHIVDYKYGEGIMVSPVENLQCAIYARTVLEVAPPSARQPNFPVFIHIFQPRNRHGEEASVWETTWGEILSFTNDSVGESAYKILTQGSKETFPAPHPLHFVPSDKACQWCLAKGFCEARRQYLTGDIETLAVIDSEPKHFPPVKSISVTQLAAVLKHAKGITKWLKDAEEYAEEHMKAGGKIPGFKLALSKGGHRYWTDPKKAQKVLLEDTILKRSDIIEESLASPAQVEKLLGKHGMPAEMDGLIGKPAGSPCIVPEDDKRPALDEINVEDEFAE